MERDAHYAAVGIATVALIAALAVFTIWLARLQFANDYDLYDIVFYGPVRGLSEGGEVHFNGIRVGEVTDLNLDPNKGDRSSSSGSRRRSRCTRCTASTSTPRPSSSPRCPCGWTLCSRG